VILNAVQSGAGPAVVLLHGLFGSARNFGHLQRALSDRYRVIALDLRNHGDSPHGDDMRYTVMAADVRETLAALGAVPAAVIGHSMGGKTAMALALQWPNDVGRLLVADIAPVPYQHGNASVARAMRDIPLAATLTRKQADAALAAVQPAADVRAFLLQNLRLGPEPRWRIGLAEIAAAIPDLEGWAPTGAPYAGPALFVTGAASGYVLPEHRPAIRQAFPAARFVAVKNAGHWLHADNPAGFLSVVNVFLSPLQ
jgi:pimeloyl-ACP methyl ester carboxylesterase